MNVVRVLIPKSCVKLRQDSVDIFRKMNTHKGGVAAKTTKYLRNISAIFFDLDNTLIPTRKGDSKACKKLCEVLIHQYDIQQEEAERITSTFLQSFRSCPDNPQTTIESWRSYLWSQALPDHLKEQSTEIYNKWLQLRYKYLAISKDCENLLQTLRSDYGLALITNGPSNAQWEKINMLNLRRYFDCILVSADLPWEKPNPNIFWTACNILNVKPNQCAMIGDKLETDIKGGKDAKLGATIWVPLNPDQNDNDVQPVPDVVVKNVCEMLNYLPSTSSGLTTRRHSQTAGMSSAAFKRSRPYRRVLSLSEINSSNENSLDGS